MSGRALPNEGEAWEFTREEVQRYFERVLSRKTEIREPPALPAVLTGTDFASVQAPLQELLGGYYFELAGLVGKRTAEMHAALASSMEPDVAPEPFSLLYQRSVYQSMRSHVRRVFELLRGNMRYLPEAARIEALGVLTSEEQLLQIEHRIVMKKLAASRFRIHGDYHLGQVLYTGKDFMIIDFEGEPARSLSERRLKRSPLVDVAGMLRSFHYAAYSALFQYKSIRPEDIAGLEPWAELWAWHMGASFLRSYLEPASKAGFLPPDMADLNVLLNAFLMDKAVYELGYELNNRPDWVLIPIRGLKNVLKSSA